MKAAGSLPAVGDTGGQDELRERVEQINSRQSLPENLAPGAMARAQPNSSRHRYCGTD
jgi:hypothetical protein